MRRVSILAVIDTLGQGGAEQVLVNIAPGLLARGYAFEVAALRPPYDLGPVLEAEGVPVHRLEIKQPWNAPRVTVRLWGLVKRIRPQVIHSHLFFPTMYTALTAAVTRSPRRIATFHNFEYRAFPANTILKRSRKWLDGFLARRGIDCCTAVSRGVADYCAEELGIQDVRVIPNPIGGMPRLPAGERAALRSRFGCRPDDCIVAAAGKLVPLKGYHVLLDALEILATRGFRPQAIMIGDGPLRSWMLRRIGEAGLSNHVAVCGPLDHPALMRMLSAADVFAMPSLHEGFGLAAAEAMALGLPVVAARVSGLSELIEDGISGLLVPPNDPSAFADAIAGLMVDPSLREKLGQAARIRAREHYSVEKVSRQWDALYQEVTAGAASGACSSPQRV